jgi:hypothetical protein
MRQGRRLFVLLGIVLRFGRRGADGGQGSGMSWLRCDSAACWCALGPRVIASTGQAYTVAELPGDGPARLFRYEYLGGAA